MFDGHIRYITAVELYGCFQNFIVKKIVYDNDLSFEGIIIIPPLFHFVVAIVVVVVCSFSEGGRL